MIASDLTKGLNFPKKGTGTFSYTMKLFRYQYLLYKIHNYFFLLLAQNILRYLGTPTPGDCRVSKWTYTES